MDLSRINRSGGGVLDGIKSKLGFADADPGYDDNYYDQGYDDYGEYGDDYADYRDEDGYDAAPSSNYDPYAPVTTRPASARSRGAHAAGVTPPKLVSIDDVRARTQVPESLHRDPLPPRRVSSAGSRTMVEAASTAAAGTPNARAAAASGQERSESLNALFAPTAAAGSAADPASAPAPAAAHAASVQAAAPAAGSSAAGASASVYDPYDAYAGGKAAKHSPTRSVKVLKPASYAEVEHVAKALKAGDAVVLALRNTPDHLAKRILDFSFGVSSALDASVDCIADKVFVIARGAALSDAELSNLRNQGVL